jgi:hypothetical protein
MQQSSQAAKCPGNEEMLEASLGRWDIEIMNHLSKTIDGYFWVSERTECLLKYATILGRLQDGSTCDPWKKISNKNFFLEIADKFVHSAVHPILRLPHF